MKFSADDLQKLDALEHVRANPEMYTGHTTPNPAIIAGGIAQDAIALGARDTRVFRSGDWWVITADVDWLIASCESPVSPMDLFNRVIAFPEYGVNSMRHEILATAFATNVISLSRKDRLVVSGDVAENDPVWANMLCQWGIRAIAFRMPD